MNTRILPFLIVSALILLGSAGAGAIPGLQEEYVTGDTITIVITDSDESTILATLEANEFDLNKENLNFTRTYVASSDEKDDKVTWTLKIDTTGVPLGTYNLVIKGDTKTIAAEKVKIVKEKTVVQEPEPQKETPAEKEAEIPVEETIPETPASPGFGILALLGVALLPCLRKQ